jgi:hypothetical protein
MAHLGIISGLLQPVYQKEDIPLIEGSIVLVAIMVIPKTTYFHLHLLEITTTVNRAIQQAHAADAYHLYSTDPLWDGQQCENQCCSNGKSPPWFSMELPNPTTDDIEVRICIGQPSYDDIVIQIIELYVL